MIGKTDYILLTAGSRMQANVFRVFLNENSTFDMSHICSYMNSKEQDAE